MRYLDLALGERRFRAALDEEAAPVAAAALWARLPLVARAIHDEWSGQVVLSIDHPAIETGPGDRAVPFAHPGLVVVDAATGALAVAYGPGQFRDGFGSRRAVPVARIGGDLGPLAVAGTRLQYDGATALVVRRAEDQLAPLAEPPAEPGREIEVLVAGVVTRGRLLEGSAPRTAAALARILPIAGTATNTFLSGPLLRVRTRAAGGADDETPLDVEGVENGHRVLYPGYVYYRAVKPRGLRIVARDATTMSGDPFTTAMPLTPVARLEGDLAGIRRVAERLKLDGAKPIAIRLVPLDAPPPGVPPPGR